MIWLPIESDSEIITQYAHKLGMKNHFQFVDLYSFDPQTAQEFGIPVEQCKGMILLFPLEGDETIKSKESSRYNSDPKFIKQTIENSCCLMALLHILLNNPEELLDSTLTPESVKKLISTSSELEEILETSEELKGIHEEMAKIGGTEVPDLNAEVNFHFIALIPKNGSIWVMDGRNPVGPIEFKQNSNNFFDSACKIAVEEFVNKSDQINFASVILI